MRHGWGEEECIQGFGWEAGKKEPLGRPRRRLEDNNKLDLREIGHDDMDSIHLANDRG
jgi:hypothetical protein